MNVIVSQDFEESCKLAANIMLEQIVCKPDCRLGLATGSTAEAIYPHLVNAYQSGKVDFSQVRTCNLDEYVGLEPDHEQSYRASMDRWLFDHVNIDKGNTVVASGQGDPAAATLQFKEEIKKDGHMDLQLLGVGENGHIGFNEPAEKLHLFAHREQLSDSTIEANCRFFESKSEVPKEAISMGIGDIMQSRKLLLVAYGKNKAKVMKTLLMDEFVTTMVPVTLLKLHRDLTVLIDQELAAEIGYTGDIVT